MRKTILAVLTLCLFWGLALPAYATGEIDPDVVTQGQQEETQVQEPQEPTQEEKQPEDQQEPQDSSVVVSTLEELQAAVDAAEDGDTIYISSYIPVMGCLQTEKSITLKRQENFKEGSIFGLFDNGVIDGFRIVDTPESDRAIYVTTSRSGVAYLQNCEFVGNEKNFKSFIYNDGSNIIVSDCSFTGNSWVAIECVNNAKSTFTNCSFRENKSGAISSISSILEMNNCTIMDNFSYSDGAITTQYGKAVLTNCEIFNNQRYGEKVGLDIFSYFNCELTINGNRADGNFYKCLSGEKVELPVTNCSDTLMIVYLTEEQATEYFAPEPPKEEEPTPPEPGDNEETPPEQPQPPQEPGDQTGEDDTTGGEQTPQEPTQPPEGDNNDNPDNGEQGQPQEPVQPPQDNPTEPPIEPVQPPEGEGKDDPAVTPPEAPEQPVEPPQDDSKDDPTDTPITTPDTPQQPTDSDDSEDDYTPPVSHKPAHRPATSVATPIKPSPTPESKDKPKLSCGGAVIDTSRTVVLLGYGDGLQHEEDPLTRAQLATIVFRLLDENSIAQLSNPEAAFVDVPPEMWCYEYVQCIQKTGIVYGTGGGCYSPNGLVTWAQVVTVLSRFVEPQEYALQHIQYDGWAQEAVQTAVALGWIQDRADFAPDAIISRGEFVRFVNGVLAMYR